MVVKKCRSMCEFECSKNEKGKKIPNEEKKCKQKNICTEQMHTISRSLRKQNTYYRSLKYVEIRYILCPFLYCIYFNASFIWNMDEVFDTKSFTRKLNKKRKKSVKENRNTELQTAYKIMIMTAFHCMTILFSDFQFPMHFALFFIQSTLNTLFRLYSLISDNINCTPKRICSEKREIHRKRYHKISN